jgi:AcrR family transcriptional regulator
MPKGRSDKARTPGTKHKRRVAPKGSPPSSTAGEKGRLALVRAAERLMSERGIDAVSLREVSAAAGQANNSAVGYHFGTREALVDAILERHSLPIHQRWAAQLDLLSRHPPADVRPYVELLVVEITNKLDDPDGGWEFISISAQLSVAPVAPLVLRRIAQAPTVLRLISTMLPYYTAPAPLLAARLELLASALYASLVARRRAERDKTETCTRSAFVSDLVDALVALVLEAPSPSTLAALEASTPIARPTASPRAAKARR